MWLSFIIVCLYLIISLSLGVYLNKKSKANTSTKSFFIANGGLGLPFVVALLFGEMVAGSSTVGNAGTAFSSGYTSVWVNWGMALGVFMFMVVVMKFYRQAGYYGAMTVPEAFAFRFGSKVRMVVVVIIMVVYGIVWSQQPIAGAAVICPMIGADQTVVTWIVGILFIIMALVGIKGVAVMNVLHTIVMIVGMCIVGGLAVNKVGGVGNMLNSVPEYYTNLFYPDAGSVIATAMGSMFGFICSSTLVNTIYSAKGIRTGRIGLSIAAVMVILIALLPATIGIVGSILYPQASPNTILYTVAEGFGKPVGIIVSMAVMAAIFSTGPGVLLTLGSTMTQDLYAVIKPEATMQQRLRFNRIVVIIIGIAATYLGMQSKSILSTISGAFQIRSAAAIVLIVGVHWKKVDNRSAFISLLAGGIVAAAWMFLKNPYGISPFWAGNITGLVLLVILSIASNKGMAEDYREYLKKVEAIPPNKL